MPKGFGAAVIISICAFACGCGVSRTLQIEANPPDAIVSVDGQQLAKPPVQTKATWGDDKAVVKVRLEREGYEEVVKPLGFAEAKAAPEPWPLQFKLEPLTAMRTLMINSNVDEAGVRINGTVLSRTTPVQVPLKFVRET